MAPFMGPRLSGYSAGPTLTFCSRVAPCAMQPGRNRSGQNADPGRDPFGIKLETVTLAMLGKAKRVLIEKANATIVEGGGKKPDIQGRCAQIRAQVEETTSDYDREKLQELLAKLAGGVAVTRVGGSTEVEMKECKDRVDDALHATRAAVEEGIVPGGGVALARATLVLAKTKADNDNQRFGIEIVRKAVQTPRRQIAENAGEDGAAIAGQRPCVARSSRPGRDCYGDRADCCA